MIEIICIINMKCCGGEVVCLTYADFVFLNKLPCCNNYIIKKNVLHK